MWSYQLPADIELEVKAVLSDWQRGGKMRRLWSGDAGLWTGEDEAEWLGWLNVAGSQIDEISHLVDLARDARDGEFSHVLLLGMGGSSLCPQVLSQTFEAGEGSPRLLVLDSTDPARIRSLEAQIDLRRTLFVVSSKSGSTLEPNIFKQYFMTRAEQVLPRGEAASRFIAVTDPGSSLEKMAQAERFRHILPGVPSIGGRYSALSNFGMAPAALMGMDYRRLLANANLMAHECGPDVPAEHNQGLELGAIIGVCANSGRDKLTIVASPGIASLGAWLEQLLAESTGKNGKGIIPVDGEEPAAAATYGTDRLFVYLRLETEPDARQDAAIEALEAAGQPVVRIALADRYELGREFFRWEIATAVAGSVIGINPFNQPDVEASKVVTRELTSAYEKSGSLPSETPIFEQDGVALFADSENASALKAKGGKSLVDLLRAHLGRLGPGDYFALLAYIEMSVANEERLQAVRHAVRDSTGVATCLGFGPRFLHSTGQAYKGGPNSGVFLQITCDDANDMQVPGANYTFGVVKAAQARGDLEVLFQRRRRALRVHLGADLSSGLGKLRSAIVQALV